MSHRRPSGSPRPGVAVLFHLGGRAAMLFAAAGASLALASSAQAGPLQGTSAFGWDQPGSSSPSFSIVAGDLNDDGFADLAFARDTTVLIVPGSRSSVNRRNIEDGDPAGAYELTAPAPITNVSAAGDFDGDGHDDLVVGTSTKAYVFYGAASPLVGAGSLVSSGRITTITGTASKATSDRPLQGVGIGDFDGDRRDDIVMSGKDGSVAIVYGGARTATIDANGKNARTSVMTAGQDCGVLLYIIPTCTRREAMASGIGDFNGDGRADLALDSSVLYYTGRRSILLGRAGTFSTTADAPSNAFRIQKGLQESNAVYGSMPVRVGDLNGDGKDELFQPSSMPANDRTASRYVLGTSTPPASVDPQTAPSIDVVGGFDARPVGDQNGDGRRDIAVLTPIGPMPDLPYRGPSELRLVTAPTSAGVINAAGGTVVKGLPLAQMIGSPVTDFDGDGLLDLVLVASDYARAPSAPWRRFLYYVATHGADVVPPYLTAASISPSQFLPSDGATISLTSEESDIAVEISYTRQVGGTESTVATERRTVGRGTNELKLSGTVNGITLPAGSYIARFVPIDESGNRGPERQASFTLAGGPEPTLELPRSVGDLKRSGDAILTADGSVMLTNGNPGSVGTAVFPLKRDYNGRTVEFDLGFFGSGAEGMTMAFITAEPDAKGAWIGRGGQQLGVGGLGGWAFAFDRSKGPGDPSDNFIGWSPGTVDQGMQWVYTADPGVAPDGGISMTAKVKVVFADQSIRVFVNDVLRMDEPALVSRKSRLAFTASSKANDGAFVDLSNLKVS